MPAPHRLPTLIGWCRAALAPRAERPARHHLVLLRALQRLARGGRGGRGGADRLMVLMPPGSAKSTYASLLFPAWWLARNPTSAVIAASHTADLASHFGRQLRNLIAEHEGVLGLTLARDSHAAHRFHTAGGGQYFATGIDGPMTGRRADLVVIDDPIKTWADADSPAQRQRLWDWYRAELVTRLRPGGRIVLVMTRWHEDDLGGRLLAAGDGWEVLRLPALAEAPGPDEAPDALGRAEGEALWPDWESREALLRKQETVGSRVWQALYQQRPAPPEGQLFPAARIAVVEQAPPVLAAVRAWDLAATEAGAGRDPDWTVGLKLGRDRAGQLYVLDVVRLRGGPHDIAAIIRATADADGTAVTVGLPQDPGQAGKVQVAWLTSLLAGHRVIASPETGAKLTRATPVAAAAEAGLLSLVRAPWNASLLDELANFPQGRKDDQVDALARAHTLLTERPTPGRRAFVGVMER